MNILILLILPLLGYGPWESVGPQGGEVKAVLQSTAEAGTLFALSGYSPTQVVRSTDGGNSWSTISTFTNGTPYDMVMTATGKLVAVGSSRVWTSSDNGMTWSASYFSNTYFYDAVAHPTDGEEVFASGYKYNGSNWDMTFYHSTDAGVNWTSVPVIATGNTSYGRCIDVSTSNPDHILVGGYEYNAGYTPYLFLSTNGGTSFSDVTPPSATSYMNGAAFHPTNPDILLAGSISNMWRSTDSGATWANMRNQTYNYDISFSSADNNLVFSTGSSLAYRSTDGGITWSTINSGLSGANIKWISPDYTNSSMVYTGSSAGFYSSSNSGSSWTAQNTGLLVGKVLAMEDVNGWIFMNMEDLGLFKAQNGPTLNWQEVTTPLACGDFCALVAVQDTVLALEGTG